MLETKKIKIINAVKELVNLEVLRRLYQNPEISAALNKLSEEERQKVISELLEDPEYEKALYNAISDL